MDKTERLAREAIILDLIGGYPSWSGRATKGDINAFVKATAPFSITAMEKAVARFHSPNGVPGHDRTFPPNASEFSEQAALFDRVEQRGKPKLRVVSYPQGALPPPGMEPAGLLRIEVDGRHVDVTRWSKAEQDEALRTGRTPETVRARLAADQSPVTPRLQRI